MAGGVGGHAGQGARREGGGRARRARGTAEARSGGNTNVTLAACVTATVGHARKKERKLPCEEWPRRAGLTARVE